MLVGKALRVTINFYTKQCLPVITWNKNYSLKQIISITHTLDKKIFAAATFEGFVSPFVSKKVKNCRILWPASVFSTFLEKR